MNKGATQCQLLFHSPGQSSGTAFAKRLDLLIYIFHQIVILLNGSIKNSCKKIQILLHCQILIEREPAGHITYPLTDFFIFFHHITSTDYSRTPIGQQQSGEYTKECTLPRPVRPD